MQILLCFHHMVIQWTGLHQQMQLPPDKKLLFRIRQFINGQPAVLVQNTQTRAPFLALLHLYRSVINRGKS